MINKSAEITIFATLLFLVLTGFMSVIIKSSKENAVKLRVELLTEVSIKSSFYEYNKMLYDKYGLMYVDTTYKGELDGGDDSFLSHVARYFDANLSAAGTDIYNIELVSTDLTNPVYASDNSHKSVKDQIRKYMIYGAGYEETLSDREILEGYISLKMNSDFYNAYFDINEENLSDTYIFYSDLLDATISEITKDLTENYSEYFDFANHIEKGIVTVYARENNERIYECSRYYSLNE